MKHKLYTRLLSLALAVGLVIGMLPSAAAVDTVGDGAGQPVTLGNGGEVSFTLPVKLYGDDGTDLSSQKSINIVIEDGQTVPLPGSYLTDDIRSVTMNDKTYSYDYVAAGFNGDRIDQLQAGIVSSKTNDNVLETHYDFGHTWREVKRTVTVTYGVWFGSKPSNASGAIAYKTQDETYTLTQTYWAFRGWEDDEGSESDSTFSPASEQNNNKNIYFMYSKDGTLVPVKELTRDKIVTLNDDGTYDLTLTVSGAAGSITNPQKLDVLFIVDKSNSMGYYMGEDEEASKGQRRIDEVAKATKLLTGSLSGNQNIDVRYSVITFSGPKWTNTNGSENDAQLLQDWTDSATTVNNAVENIEITGATNYQAGIRKGISQLGSVRSDAQTVVIFLTDGLPTVRIDGGNGTNDAYSYNINAAVNEIKGMSTDSFYAIGAGPDFTSGSTESNNLNKLRNSVVADITDVFLVNDTDALQKAFEDIVGDTTSILCSNVTVTDTLSENVEIVTGGSGSGTPTSDDFTITVENENGQQVETGKGSVQVDGVTITASYNQETRQIVLDFPDNYQLKKGYTYKVSTTIRATEKAYEAYRNNENSYPDNGDKGTGTHAGEAGLYTNNKATVDYTYNGKNYSAEYPMPVIQLKPGTLTITKQITGDLENADITALEENLTFTVSLNGKESSYKLNEFTLGADNTYSLKIEGLSPNTEYVVTESGAEILGYVLDASSTGEKGTIAKGGTATAAFTNDYKVATRDISVTKVWEGSETHPESVTVWLYADGVKTNESVTLNAANGWKAFFTGLDIYNKEGKEIAYTVQEDTVNGYTGVVTGDMTKGFTITNTRDVGNLTIKKTVEGLDDAALDELKNKLTFTVTGPDGYSEEIAFNATGWEQDGNTYTYTLENVPTGTYTVTETGYDTLEKYSWVEKDSTATANADVTKGATATAALTNVYIGKDGTLNINKVVTGFANNGKPVFDFKLTATDGTVYYYHVDMTGTGANQEKLVASVTLPVGEYTIEELSNQNYTLKSVAGADNKGDGTYKVTIKPQGTTTVTFTNDPKNTNIPTDGSATENRVESAAGGVIVWKKDPVEYGKDEGHDNITPKPTPEPSVE